MQSHADIQRDCNGHSLTTFHSTKLPNKHKSSTPFLKKRLAQTYTRTWGITMKQGGKVSYSKDSTMINSPGGNVESLRDMYYVSVNYSV